VDPWPDDTPHPDEPTRGRSGRRDVPPDDGPPRPSNWGCAIAAIIGSIALVIAIVIALTIANGFAGDVVRELI
jgi:hypothetical protein